MIVFFLPYCTFGMQEGGARENKEERISNVVGTGDNDIGNLGTDLMDSSMVLSPS